MQAGDGDLFRKIFSEVRRIVVLKGIAVILMPHSFPEGHWDNSAEFEALAPRKMLEHVNSSYRL